MSSGSRRTSGRIEEQLRHALELLGKLGTPMETLRIETATRLEAMASEQSAHASTAAMAAADLRKLVCGLDEMARASATRMSALEARVEEGTASTRTGMDDVRRFVRALESRIAERIGDLERASGARDARLEQVAVQVAEQVEGLRADLGRRSEELPALLASALSVGEAQLSALRVELAGVVSSGDAHWVQLRDGLPGLLSRAIGPVGEHLRLLRADTQHHAEELPGMLARALASSEEQLKALRAETRKLSLLESAARALQGVTSQAAAELQEKMQSVSSSVKLEAEATRRQVDASSGIVQEHVQREVRKLDAAARDEVIRASLARLIEETATIEPRLAASVAEEGRRVERLAKRLEGLEKTLEGIGEELRKKRGWFS